MMHWIFLFPAFTAGVFIGAGVVLARFQGAITRYRHWDRYGLPDPTRIPPMPRVKPPKVDP